jgi:hypothetical protein
MRSETYCELGGYAFAAIAAQFVSHRWRLTMNAFNDTIKHLTETPQAQRPDVLIDDICQQMQASGGARTLQELGQELQTAKAQLVKAFNQRQQGG